MLTNWEHAYAFRHCVDESGGRENKKTELLMLIKLHYPNSSEFRAYVMEPMNVRFFSVSEKLGLDTMEVIKSVARNERQEYLRS